MSAGPRKDNLGPANPYPPRAIIEPTITQPGFRSGCICGKHMIQLANAGTCLWCGHGNAVKPLELAYDKATKLNTSAPLDGRVLVLPKRKGAWDEDGCVTAYRRWEAANGRVPHAIDWQRAIASGEVKRPSYGTIYKLFGGWTGFLQYIAEVPREQVAA